jgi:3D (Asp-Asp-Asp) domain-containing protein
MKCNIDSFFRAVSLAAVFWTTVSMSAYTPHETGSRTTASGAKAKEGYTCAANFVPLGSVIIYNGHKYVVQDRMNPKYNRHVDIFMESHKKAIEFGRKEAKVQVLTQGDTPKKTSTKKESKKQNNKKTKQQSPVKNNKKNDSTPTVAQSTHTSNPSNTQQANPHTPWAPSVLKPQAKP